MGWPRAVLTGLSAVALGVTCAPSPAAPAGAAAAAAEAADAPPSGAREWRYRIAAGDTLIALAALYLDDPDDWQALQRHNRLGDPRRLVPGSWLRIPFDWLRREATVAEVVFVQGKVSVQRLGDAAQTPVAIGMVARPSDTFRTSAQSSVSLRFVDGSRLLIVPDSQMTMEQLLVYGRTGISDTRLRVDRGSVDTRVVPNAARAPAFEVRTPAINLGVRGTDFRVHVADSGDSARVEVLEGRVGAGREETPGASASTVLVDAGFGTVTERDQAPGTPFPLLPAPPLPDLAEPLARLALRWRAVEGARAYRVQVFADGQGDALLLDTTVPGPATDWVPDADLPDGRYVLRVRAIDRFGLEGLNAASPFELRVRPASPLLEWPPRGAVRAVERVPIRWAPTPGVTRYRLQVAEDGDFAALKRDEIVSGNSIELALPPGVYHWRVAGVLGEGGATRAGPFGAVNVFDQRAVPDLPAMEEPQFSPNSLLLRWKPTAAGQGVQLQLARGPDFVSPLVDQRTWAAQLQLARPPAGTYYWRLRSIVGDGPAGGFGPAQAFAVPALSWWESLWADAPRARP